MSNYAIVTYNLTKRYPGAKRFALKSLDIDVKSGEVYGFLGPNGAGKTTTIRILMDFIRATAGEARILGRDTETQTQVIMANIGYLPGEVRLYDKMTGRQFLRYMAAIQKPKRPTFARQLIKLFEADINTPLGNLSKGNRQKIGIIQAFMHEPEVLILDEPTSGLDPLMQEAFFELVRLTKRRGATLFISSHNLSEVQKICDRVGFIRNGKLVAEQKIGDFSHAAVQTYDISFADKAPLTELKRVPRVKVKANTSRHVTVQVKGELGPLLALLAKHHVHSIDRRESNLETQFLRFYKGQKQ